MVEDIFLNSLCPTPHPFQMHLVRGFLFILSYIVGWICSLRLQNVPHTTTLSLHDIQIQSDLSLSLLQEIQLFSSLLFMSLISFGSPFRFEFNVPMQVIFLSYSYSARGMDV